MGLRPMNFLRSFSKRSTYPIPTQPSTQSLKVPG
jgi:hypothetical protein